VRSKIHACHSTHVIPRMSFHACHFQHGNNCLHRLRPNNKIKVLNSAHHISSSSSFSSSSLLLSSPSLLLSSSHPLLSSSFRSAAGAAAGARGGWGASSSTSIGRVQEQIVCGFCGFCLRKDTRISCRARLAVAVMPWGAEHCESFVVCLVVRFSAALPPLARQIKRIIGFAACVVSCACPQRVRRCNLRRALLSLPLSGLPALHCLVLCLTRTRTIRWVIYVKHKSWNHDFLAYRNLGG
jgi:hypothetical protein